MQRTSKGGMGLAAVLLPLSLFAQGAGSDWSTYGGDLSAWRYSLLDQINTGNVSQLVPVWAFQTGDYANGLQATPIVVDGVVYLSTSSNQVFAIDGATGDLIWKYAYAPLQGVAATDRSRGVAFGHGLIFMGTDDSYLVALDQKTGEEVWRVAVQDSDQCGCSITAAPLVVKDKVVVGGNGGDRAYRGSLSAFDAKTGRFAWRFFVTAGPDDPGHDTWSGDSWRLGGGAPWMTGSFDPELDLLYWGTGNAAADFDGEPRKGDNLYTASVVALDPDTGELVWHYQTVPHDVWDFDSAYECILADLPVKGSIRKLLLHPTKGGYTWALDRITGEFVGAWPFVDEINWVSGITEDGKLVGRREPKLGEPTYVCPSVMGAKSWNQGAFSPRTGWLYLPAASMCNELYVRKQEPVEGKGNMAGFWRLKRPGGRENYSSVTAFDPVTGEKKWEHPYPYILLASVLTTAGDLVFTGDPEGRFFALDARTGERLWSFQTGSGHRGSAVSYEIDGRQYIATPSGYGSIAGPIMSMFDDYLERDGSRSGGTLFVFALSERAR